MRGNVVMVAHSLYALFNKATDDYYESPVWLQKQSLIICPIGSFNSGKASLFLTHWCHMVAVGIFFILAQWLAIKKYY